MKEVQYIDVFKLEEFYSEKSSFINTDNFYKILLVKRIHERSDLIFIKPGTAIVTDDWREGCLCIFSRTFFSEAITDKLNQMPSHYSDEVIYILDKKQEIQLEKIFEKMMAEKNSHYQYRDDLLRNYISEITHLAIKSSTSGISV